jgi:lipoyl(octanoyl) transferase
MVLTPAPSHLTTSRQDNFLRGDLYGFKTVPYLVAWQWQHQLVDEQKAALLTPSGAEPRDSLLLLQHPPVYTLGQGADSRFVRFDLHQSDYEIHRIERGGEVTYHCPGQLVGYPILNLRRYQLDLHWYLRQLEEVIIQTLACYGLAGERIKGLTGVWLEGQKVAAIGIKVSRWITMHGFALNVNPDLSGFDRIVPCGIEGRAVGSLAQFLPGVSLEAVQEVVIEQFERVFRLRLERALLPDALPDPLVDLGSELGFKIGS